MKIKIKHYNKRHPEFKKFLRKLSRERIRKSWNTRCNGVTKVSVVEGDLEAVGWTMCDPRDTFIKKEGVRRAKGRALKKLAKLKEES